MQIPDPRLAAADPVSTLSNTGFAGAVPRNDGSISGSRDPDSARTTARSRGSPLRICRPHRCGSLRHPATAAEQGARRVPAARRVDFPLGRPCIAGRPAAPGFARTRRRTPSTVVRPSGRRTSGRSLASARTPSVRKSQLYCAARTHLPAGPKAPISRCLRCADFTERSIRTKAAPRCRHHRRPRSSDKGPAHCAMTSPAGSRVERGRRRTRSTTSPIARSGRTGLGSPTIPMRAGSRYTKRNGRVRHTPRGLSSTRNSTTHGARLRTLRRRSNAT